MLETIIQRIKLPFRKEKELFRHLYRILGFYPKNIAYYKQAMLHKSLAVKGKNGRFENNERLEFLGDAILDAVVGDIVYRHFEGKREGFLTNARSKIVQRETLGKLAVEIGLDKLIQSNPQTRHAHNSYMAGNAFEALVGAIYLDYGYRQCMTFVKKRILAELLDIDKVAYKEVNFKSKLLEWSQKNRIQLKYEDTEKKTEEKGSSTFHTVVIIEGIECGEGKGYSKKESQQNASRETLYMLKKQKGFEASVFEAKSKRTAMEEQPEALLPDLPEDLLESATPLQDKTDDTTPLSPKKKQRVAHYKTAKRLESALPQTTASK
ncbi:MAG: ribonuclease III [Bacteroidales bacterium]|nr:ribonuclease III [Candidatus Physcousia equi]